MHRLRGPVTCLRLLLVPLALGSACEATQPTEPTDPTGSTDVPGEVGSCLGTWVVSGENENEILLCADACANFLADGSMSMQVVGFCE